MLTKPDLIDAIMTGAQLTKSQAEAALGSVCDTAHNALRRGDEVRFPGIGTIAPVNRAATTGRNPRTGEPIEIAAKRTVKLRTSKTLLDALNGPQNASAEAQDA